MNHSLHIICPALPWPADHARAIDIFYRIKALKHAGTRIQLHYFSEGPARQDHPFHEYCESVNEYPAGSQGSDLGWNSIQKGHTVCSEALRTQLMRDASPVLVEGTECCGFMEFMKHSSNRVIVRFQFNPFHYLHEKVVNEKKLIRKIKWLHRIRSLTSRFRHLGEGYSFAFMNKEDAQSFKEKLPKANVFVLPAFLAKDEVNCACGTGNFCLYHADLSVPENEKTAIWLLEKVFNDLPVPFVIAGRKPSRCLNKTTHLYHHACLISDPAPEALEDLVNKAHINILPALSYPGPGIDLVQAMQSGRHCIVNEKAILNTGFERQCHIANDPKEFKTTILELYHKPFETPEKYQREKIISAQFNNERGAKDLIDRFWGSAPGESDQRG